MDAIDNDNDNDNDDKKVNKSQKQTQRLYRSEASNQTLAQHSDIGIVNNRGENCRVCVSLGYVRGEGGYICICIRA